MIFVVFPLKHILWYLLELPRWDNVEYVDDDFGVLHPI